MRSSVRMGDKKDQGSREKEDDENNGKEEIQSDLRTVAPRCNESQEFRFFFSL